MKDIPGVMTQKSKLLAPILTYEVDIGKTRLQIVEANRVDQMGDTLIFMIEYSDFNVYVAGFKKWKSFQIQKKQEKESKPILKKLVKKSNSRLKKDSLPT